MSNYSHTQAKEGRYISELIYDYTPPMCTTNEGVPEDFKLAQVGIDGVEDIQEHTAAGEGDKWFYDVYYDDGSVLRTFNPHSVVYNPIKQQS